MIGINRYRFYLICFFTLFIVSACSDSGCEVICDIDETQCTIDITCETGSAMCKMERSTVTGPKGELKKYTRNDECTYDESGNTYHIEGEVNFDANEKVDDYYFEVTGGEFGNTPQICVDP